MFQTPPDERGFLTYLERAIPFHVEMTANPPQDMDVDRATALKEGEKAMSQKLQRDGVWRHLWRRRALREHQRVRR
jgi:muconolactone delta-isomerase